LTTVNLCCVALLRSGPGRFESSANNTDGENVHGVPGLHLIGLAGTANWHQGGFFCLSNCRSRPKAVVL
jgi:hypothetical protein